MFHNGNKIKAAVAISTFMILSFFILFLKSCLGPTKKTTVEVPGSPVEDVLCPDGSKVGDTKKEACDGDQIGEKVYVCREGGTLDLALDSCRDEEPQCDSIVSFEDVKPILTSQCVSCHFTPTPYDDYELASTRIDEFMRRINLGVNNPERMPKEPISPLSIDDRNLLDQWISDGLKESNDDCDENPVDLGSIDLFDIESAILSDLAKIEQSDRRNTRYLVMSHKLNLGERADQISSRTQAIGKVLNSLNADLEDLYPADAIDEKKSIYRFDLRTYALERSDWLLIEDNDKFDVESFTDEGETIKFLTGARKAWLHFDNFIDITQEASVYYEIMDVSNDLLTFFNDVGVNVQAQFDDFSSMFLGFNGSEISNQKNRLIVRFEGRDGYVWITFDPIDIDGDRTRNLFAFPCLLGTGCDEIFNFAAGEVIWTLPNGMQGYALYDSAGVRQDKAAVELGIVFDTRSPVDPEINNAIDCHRCHAKGILPSVDEIREHVLRNGNQFDADDRQIILELYKDQGANNAAFQLDNRIYANALESIGVNQNIDDPITSAWDDHLLDWSSEEVGSFLFISPSELKSCIEGSAGASSEVGQLVTGGRITFDQFVEVLPTLKLDCRLFQEPL